MRRTRNCMFAFLVVVGIFASSRGVLADWGNWDGGPYDWTWFGACVHESNCYPTLDQTLFLECFLLCQAYNAYVGNYWCYYNGGGAHYPDEPNCWAECNCVPNPR